MNCRDNCKLCAKGYRRQFEDHGMPQHGIPAGHWMHVIGGQIFICTKPIDKLSSHSPSNH